jgi:hypothetical protein
MDNSTNPSFPSTRNRLAALGLSALMVASSVVGMSAPASAVSATNSPVTYLNEYFNGTGYLVDQFDSNTVEIEGVISNIKDFSDRSIVVTVEDNKAVLRAYKPVGDVSEFDPNWLATTSNSEVNFAVDSSFGTGGKLVFPETVVTNVLVQQRAMTSEPAESVHVPNLIVTHQDGQTLYRFGETLSTCTTDCLTGASKSELKAAIESVGGAGAVATGIFTLGTNEIAVSGMNLQHTPPRPFVAKLNISVNPATASSSLTIASDDYPAPADATYSFTPVEKWTWTKFAGWIIIFGRNTQQRQLDQRYRSCFQSRCQWRFESIQHL